MASSRDLWLAAKAKRYGANYSLRIIWEARRAGIPISLGFAMVEKESDFRNVFGHDPTSSIPRSWMGTKVTRKKYLHYRANRMRGLGMQGVGPTQLTWYEFQYQADRLGGCHIPRHNIRVGFGILADYYKDAKRQGRSTRAAIEYAGKRYNGANAYGYDLYRVYSKWHRRLG